MTAQKIAEGAYFVPSYSTLTIEPSFGFYSTQTVLVGDDEPESDDSVVR